MKDCKITIVTPTYNRAHTLPRAYESLKKQTFKGFKWLIMDDGSTDNTEELVKEFQTENLVDIEYRRNQNSKKFYTVFKAIESVKTDYFTVLDSDDAYVENALELMFEAVKNLNEEFISATFHSQFPDGKIVGTSFPENLDGSILEMRYKYKVRGDKHTVFITQPYLKYLSKFDYEFYKGKYAPQKIFYQIYDGDGMKSRFVNQIVRIYYQDLNDGDSMSADRIKPSSYLGLRNGHLSFLNSYGIQLWHYPIPLLRNLVGYQLYSHLLKINLKNSTLQITNKSHRILSVLIFPFSYLLLLQKEKQLR